MGKYSAARWARTLFAYAVAIGVGAAAFLLHVPLAWVLGPLLAAAILSVTGFDFIMISPLRRAGQVIVGASIGLNVTAEVAAGLLYWLVPIIITGLVAVFVAATLSVGFSRLANVDLKTGFFAMMPGGLAEMGNIGASVGARPEPIAIAQALRVALVVFLIPPLLIFLHDGAVSPPIFHDYLAPAPLALILVVGGVTAFIAGRLKLNNPWAIGPLLAAAVLTSTGVVAGHMPLPVFFAGQVLLGFAIGSLFKRDLVRQLPRVVSAGSVFVILVLAAMVLFGVVLAWITGLAPGTAILAASPGGMTEMAVTAQTLHLNTALVAIFHVCRAIMVNGFATYYWALFDKSGYLTALDRLLGARATPTGG